MQSESKPEPCSPNSEEVEGKPDSGKRKRLNEEIKRENGERERERVRGEVKERDL